ncbi:MAG: zinc-binding dehydrogenase, partial [Nitriliruptoraceae bacterium]
VPATADIPPEQLALAEPLSCCINGLDQYRVDVGDTVVILGAGPIGLLHLQLARLSGATTVIVSDPAGSRRDAAAELGATMTVDPTAADLPTVVADATGGRGADVAVVCIGHPELVNDALRLVRVRGRVSIFAGLSGRGWAEIEANLVHYRELTVVGASNSARAHYERAVDLICRGWIDTERLVTHRFPLDRASEAIDFVASGEGLKVAVIPDLDDDERNGHGH